MGNAVTTNPVIIMMINMTVVFAVLFGLSLMIRLIHVIDPTRKKEVKAAKPAPAAPAVSAAPAATAPTAPAAEEGIPTEVVAVIAAAVTACGYSSSQIRTIRPLQRNNWKQAGRFDGVQRL